MNIDVTYVTVSDAGNFFSEAKLDCVNGEVFDIQPVEDDDAESIEHVFDTFINFNYKGEPFECDVDPQSDKVLDYQNTQFFKVWNSDRLAEKLSTQLKENKTSSIRPKL